MAQFNIQAYKAVGGGIFLASPPHFTSYIIYKTLGAFILRVVP